MTTRIQLGDIAVDVVKKDIKNVHLSVHPPTGRVRISAPLRMSIDTIRVFAVSKLEWVKKQQKWGSCNTRSGNIRLNSELAKKPRECLEYVLVHELVHFLEPTHNQRFVSLMDQFMPKWRFHRDELNRFPVRHETWLY
jgi:predicted metal-dependent hydrolase